MPTLSERFFDLFRGNLSAHGTYAIDPASAAPGEKVKGTALTLHSPVNPELWEQHLSGESGIGIIPIDEKNTCGWGAIDVDEYKLDLGELVGRIARLKFPLVTCRSKSGGAHLFIFLTESIPAGMVQDKLRELASILGYADAEIFPKQRQILTERKDVGNWINMPYQGTDDALRYGISDSGQRLTAEEFCDLAESSKVSPSEFEELSIETSEDEFTTNGPPCLKMLCSKGFPEGTRNKGLFNIGILARKKWPDSWRHRISELNLRYMNPPLSEAETHSVLGQIASRQYNYTCKQEPLVGYCNRPLCRMMPFGIDDSPQFTISSLSKLDTDPPLWFLDVEGKRLQLTTDDLQTQRRFQKECIQQLGINPPMRKKEEWEALLTELLSKMTVIKMSEDVTPQGQFLQHLENFCTGRVQGRSIDDLLEGKPFSENGKTAFRISDLQRYLDHHNFKELRLNTISNILRERRSGNAKTRSLKGKSCRYWEIDAFDEQTEPHNVHVDERKSSF